jgi:DNA-directed RNA polymerase subunit RPC12/RpoP
MFHRITCPTCQHKFTVPEGVMGQRQTCPNCQALFLAGKSVAEAEVPMKLQPAAAGAAPFNKTMLGETDAPIKYNCPRCKKPLESPASEALTKKPCPACGGRLQVPAAPKAAAQPNLNKTILASDDNAVQAGAPIPAVTVLPPPAPRAEKETATTAPARSPFASPLAIFGMAGVGIILLALMACGLTMFLTGGGERDRIAKAKQDYEKAQKELDDLKRSIAQNEALMLQKRQLEQEHSKKWDEFMRDYKSKQDDMKRERDNQLASVQDQDAKARLKQKLNRDQEDQERLDRERKDDNDKKNAAVRAEIAALKAQVDAANQRVQQAPVIMSPPVYYPPYHYRRYWGDW